MLSTNGNSDSSHDNEIVIKVENLSKKFSRSLKWSIIYGLIDVTRNIFGFSSKSHKLRKREFWALDNISFEVRNGERLGIVGPNGSGKTTLLTLLNGIYMPDKGKISIKGSVGALIALGAGFHPMLTGRENVRMGAAIIGMSNAEIEQKFDDIVKFADLADFIDVPVKFYSTGMFARLGFSVAVHLDRPVGPEARPGVVHPLPLHL
ncbi:MAG: ABC transporter ATP-binding protein, partial [Candidatus Hodarchaeota archaeon]